MIVLWYIFIMKSHDYRFNPDSLFFGIYVTVLREPSSLPDALSNSLHIRLMYQLILYMTFFFQYFSFLPMLFSNENHLLQSVIYVTKKIFVKIQRCFKVFSWLIMDDGFARIRNNTIKGHLQFLLQLFLKLLPLVNYVEILSHLWL